MGHRLHRPGKSGDRGLVGPAAHPADRLGGAWSSYWYNGFVYESSIAEGLNIFRVSGKAVRGALRLRHLNPQTQEFTLR
ncbi:MAG: hypothetical protein GEV03_19690 [Streptosporangiales bacterium]|nr:hypothetical protein [Streptosporangiales bacterium]